MNQDDNIIQTFFYVLSRNVELNKLKSAKEFFTLSESNKIDKDEMEKALIKLGYEINSPHYEFLLKKYQNFHVKTLINLNVIVEEYENYILNLKNENSSTLQKNQNLNTNLVSPDLRAVNSGFKLENEEDIPEVKIEKNLSNTKYENTGGMSTFKDNNVIEDEFNFSSGRRRSNRPPISFRPTEDPIKTEKTESTPIKSVNNELMSEVRPPTFGQVNEDREILEKLEKINKKMMAELQENLSYIKVSLYEKLYNYYLTQKEDFEMELKKIGKGDKFITDHNLEDLLDNCLVLTDEEKKIIMMDIVRNNSGKYSYEDFLEKIKNFDKNEIFNQIRNYNLNYNDYIVTLRNYFKDNKINVKTTWIEVFQSVPKADSVGFGNYLGMNGLIYKPEELDYIFKKISEDGKFIIFKNFESVLNRNPPSRESMKKSQMDQLAASSSAFKKEQTVETKVAQESHQTNQIQSNVQTNAPSSKRLSVRDNLLFSEIKNKSAQESMTIIFQRLQQYDKKVGDILSQMQNFKLFKIYENLNRIMKPMGNFAESYFVQQDLRRTGFVTDVEFNMVLTYLKIDLNDEQRELIFQSLQNRTPTGYSYREFLNKVMFYTGNELFDLTKKANQLFNDYIIEVRDYIKQNKIETIQLIEKLFGKLKSINFDQFCNFLTTINFHLSHVQESKYLFGIISDDNINLNVITFADLMMIDTPEVAAYIETGLIKRDKTNTTWKNKLINFTDEFAKTYQKNYQHLYNIFKDINTKSKKEKSNFDLVNAFESCNVNLNGEIDKNVFINITHKMGVIKDVQFHTLLQAFTNQKNDNFNLIGFLNAFYSFFYKERPASANSEEKQKVTTTEKVDTNKQSVNQESPRKKGPSGNSPSRSNRKNILEKNFKREFNQENMEYIEEVVNYLVEIILDEKKVNVVDFFKKRDTKKVGYFNKNEFIKILYEDLEIDTEGEKESLEVFYDYLVNEDIEENKKIGFEPYKIDKIVNIFKKFVGNIEIKNTNNTNNLNKQSISNTNTNITPSSNTTTNNFNSTPNLPREEKIMQEFSQYINNNRIKFSNIFPVLQSNPIESNINVFDIKSAFAYSSYPIAHDDIELLIKFLDPYNKTKIALDSIKNKIKQYAPNYFDAPFQKNELRKMSEGYTNPKVTNVIKVINEYITKNKLTIEEFFKKFDKNGDDKLSKTEFIQYMINIEEKFSVDELADMFAHIDKDNKSYITVNNFYAYFNSAPLSTHERKSKIKISNRVIEEVNSLFSHFDKDNDGKISKDDFYKALKAMNNRTTMDDVNVIMQKVDKDGNNFVDKNEFMEVMEETIRHEIVMKEEEKEYFIRLFKEEDIDKVSYLTPVQLKHLLNEKLMCDLTEDEMGEIINEVDVNRDGMIDIDEFIKLLSSKDKAESLKHTVRKINLKRKINPMTFLSIFNGLPMNFIPSFIKEEQKLFKLLPSATLRPRTDPTGILYEDILPDKINKESMTLRPISTKINAKISFETATGVAIPDEKVLSRSENILGRILKISLFNASKNSFIGNAISIEATWNKNYEDRWYFEEDKKMFGNNIIIRYNGDDYEFIQVILEFIILIKKENVVTETSCGWSSIDLKELLKSVDIKLQIKGGSPIKKDDISKSDIRTRRSGWAKFASFFSGEVKSHIPFKSKPFKELNNQDKALIDYLPSCLVIQRAAMQMCVIYRKFISKHILSNQFYSLKVIKSQHSIINNFCKILDCPDAFRPMVELWNQIVVEPATSTEKKSESYWESNLLDFVNRVYTVLYSDKFKYNDMDATQLSLGDKELSSTRLLLINSAIKFDKGKRINK